MRVWCNTCRTMREQMDEYVTDHGDAFGPSHVESYVARPLECGHDAGDGGGLPYRPRRMSPSRERALVEQVTELQDGATK